MTLGTYNALFQVVYMFLQVTLLSQSQLSLDWGGNDPTQNVTKIGLR
jgi:hypothetical protein